MPDELKDFLSTYRDEASILETSYCGPNRHVIAQQIMLHHVIIRRREEIQDLYDGMNEYGLVDFIKKHREFVPLLFPRFAESIINKDEFKAKIKLEEEDSTGEHLVLWLKQYIDHIDGLTDDGE